MIINPMFFYLMCVSENISMAMKVCGPIMIIVGVCLIIFALDVLCSKEEEKAAAFGKRMIQMGIIILFIGLLIPDKDTLLLMQAAQLATTENVNNVFEALKAAMDYAVTILQ